VAVDTNISDALAIAPRRPRCAEGKEKVMRGKEKSLRARIEELEKENASLIGSLASAWQCGCDMAIKSSARIAELEAEIVEWKLSHESRCKDWLYWKDKHEKQSARIAELEAENSKFRTMLDEQLLMAIPVCAALKGETK
jgi:hypothetical protein